MAWVEKHGSGWRVRFPLPGGTLGSENGFATKPAATRRAKEIETDQQRGDFVDPRAAQTTLFEWLTQWQDAHDVSANTWAKYQSHLRNHILPKFGAASLGDIKRIQVKAWIKALRHELASPTVADIVSLLSTILNEAVDEGLLGANPCRKLRLNTNERPERTALVPHQVHAIATCSRPGNSLLIITAAYTGMRWGELAGLRWRNVDLSTGTITVDPDTGALHEVLGMLVLGPPKTAASARTIHLPPFLTALLVTHREHQRHAHVFTSSEGELLRRSNFRRRVWRPSLVRAGLLGTTDQHGENEFHARWVDKDGVEHDQTVRTHSAAVDRIALRAADGVHFHDLRHTHKTWLIEDEVPEVAQCKRIGHKLGGVRGVYSHVTQAMIDKLLAGLQCRWEAATARPASGDELPNFGSGQDRSSQNPPKTINGLPIKITDRPFDQRVCVVGDTGIEPVTPTVSR